MCLCHHLGFKTICFIGKDLAAHVGQQYALGAADLLRAHAKMSAFHIEVPGLYGDTVMTVNSIHCRIIRHAETANKWKKKDSDMNLVSAT